MYCLFLFHMLSFDISASNCGLSTSEFIGQTAQQTVHQGQNESSSIPLGAVVPPHVGPVVGPVVWEVFNTSISGINPEPRSCIGTNTQNPSLWMNYLPRMLTFLPRGHSSSSLSCPCRNLLLPIHVPHTSSSPFAAQWPRPHHHVLEPSST